MNRPRRSESQGVRWAESALSSRDVESHRKNTTEERLQPMIEWAKSERHKVATRGEWRSSVDIS